MPEREPNQEQQKAAIIFSIQQNVPEGPLRDDLLKAVQDTFAQHQTSGVVTRDESSSPARQVRADTGAGVQESERAREQWMQKAMKAWNAADAAYRAAHSQGQNAASEAFAATWKAKCQEFQLGDINLRWQKGVYAVTDSYEGKHYIFVSVRADIKHPLLRAAFEVPRNAQQGNTRVQKPASMKSDIYAAIKGDLAAADEHEFEKGQLV